MTHPRSGASEADPFFGSPAREAGGPAWIGLGLGRGHSRGAADDAFVNQGNTSGSSNWFRERGWSPVGEPTSVPVVAELMEAAPVPVGDEHRPYGAFAGRYEELDALAFNVGFSTKQGIASKWTITAVGRISEGDAFWLHPARLGSFHRKGVSAHPVGSSRDSGWSLLTMRDDSPLSQKLAQSTSISEALLGTDGGDEIWGSQTAIAALRPDDYRPALLQHHLQLLRTIALGIGE